MERKIQVSQTRILEFGLKYPDKTYISFSGGKDSTVLMDLVRRVFPDTPAVFIDTGLEYPEVRKFAMSQQNVTVVKPELTFRQVIEKYGYPLVSKEVSQKIYEARKTPNGVCDRRFNADDPYIQKYGGRYSMAGWKWLKDSDIPISHMCCTIMKKRPVKKYEKQTGRHAFTGILAGESIMRKTEWLRNGCNAFDVKRPISHPMSFWTEQDVLEYIRRFNLPYASVYGDIIENDQRHLSTTGCDRTGCVFCCFGCHLEKCEGRFQRLKRTHPALYRFCMRPWNEGGLGLKDIFDWFNVNAPKGKRGKPHIYYE